MSQDREWMYTRYRDGKLTPEFLAGLDVFIMFACNQPDHMSGGDIKCPCKKCDNKWFHPPHVVRLHLVKNGFTPKYYKWWVHGEQNKVVVEGRSLRDEIRNKSLRVNGLRHWWGKFKWFWGEFRRAPKSTSTTFVYDVRDEPVDSEETHPHPHPPQQKIMRYEEEISFDADGRVILYIEAGLLCPTSKFRGACTASFRRKLEPTGYNWPSVSPSMKETYWGELQKSCYWDETKNSTSFVRARWEKIAGIAYKDFVSRVKRKAEKGEFKKIKGVLPHVLKAWMVEWQKPEVKAKSSQASKNRHSGPDGPGTGPVIHHGGSRGTHLIAKCVALSEGIPFEHTGLPTHDFTQGEWCLDGSLISENL